MASSAVVNAVASRIGTTWTSADTTALPVKIKDTTNKDADTPADGSPYISVDFPVANEQQLTFGDPGNNFWRETGGILIIINEVRGNGTSRVQGWADELRTLFRGQNFSGVECNAASPPTVTNDNDIGNYWQMSFVVEYRYDLAG